MVRQPKLYLMTLSAILIVVVLALVLSTTSLTPSATALAAADGQALFEQKCKSCHTIGAGRLIGPDLKSITRLRDEAWLVRFITAPDRLIAQGDPIAKDILAEYGLPMPNMGVSDDEAKAILAYIETQSGGDLPATKVSPTTPVPPASPGVGASDDEDKASLGDKETQSGADLSVTKEPPTTPIPPPSSGVGVSDGEDKASLGDKETQSEGDLSVTKEPPTTPVPPASPGDGKQIFTGKLPFQNSGPPCLSCHTVSGLGIIGGGTVGKDLTASYAALGETGLVSILKITPFPMMKEIYTAKPLHDDEIAGLVAFLKETDAARQSEPAQNPVVFFVISAAGALLVIAIFQFLWRGRLAGVRRSLVKGGSK